MKLWARTAGAAKISFKYGLSSESLTHTSSSAQTNASHDFAGYVTLNNLNAGTKYFFQTLVNGQKSGAIGSFKTLPENSKTKENPDGLFNFKFEFGCGNKQHPGVGYQTYTTMNEQIAEDIDFALLNGDWVYEEKRDYSVASWQKANNLSNVPIIVNQAKGITGCWENYKLYLDREEELRKWHRNVPSWFTFDDHEILGDINGAGTIGLRDRKAVFRDIGIRSWYDYLGWANPVSQKPIYFGNATLTSESNLLTDTKADFTQLNLENINNLHVHEGFENSRVYEIQEIVDKHTLKVFPAALIKESVSYSIGRHSYFKKEIANCLFLVLDTRSLRQMHDISNPSKKDLSLLGQKQLGWLLKETTQTKADFVFIVSSVNLMIPHVSNKRNPKSNKDEAWTAFLAEREIILNHCDKLDKQFLFLTGDLHNSFALKISDNIHEYASGPHNSYNHHAIAEGDRPATGKFLSRDRECDILWSTWFDEYVPKAVRRQPIYTVVQVNNTMKNPTKDNPDRLIAYEKPQVIIQFYNGTDGSLMYAHSISAK
ncbi:MAG: metallophosphoesterase family protein [Lentisphaerales bacterium]|nr:metallophosphoesterase family protein [Lentisphaerales bacterium]